MDVKKTGVLLRELRSERGLTQEQLAEAMGVTNRSVSRWETGSNLPDIDILIELADYYGVEVRELIDGQKRGESMDKSGKENLLKTADYVQDEKLRLIKRLHFIFIVGAIAFAVYMCLDISGAASGGVGENIADFALGGVLGILLTGVLYTSRYIGKIQAFKHRLFSKK